MSDYNTPNKQCTICKKRKPATAEYFTRDRANKDGLRPQCKACYRQKQKDWRSADPNRYKEYARQQYIKDPDKAKARAREWDLSPKGKAYNRQYYRDTKESQDAYHRARYRKNRESFIEKASNWAKSNPKKRAAIRHRYAARKNDLINDFTSNDWQYAINYFDGRCAVCGRPPGFFHKLQADHWIPLSDPDCPGTVPHNIVPLCGGLGGCNQRKNAKHPNKWMNQEYGANKARAISNRIHGYFSLVRKTKGM